MKYTVKNGDLATAWRNDIAVVSTPVLVWLCEMAALEVMEGEGITDFSVGYAHECKHVSSARLGDVLDATARLRESRGNRLVFDSEVRLGETVLMRSQHTRVTVDRDSVA